MCRSAPSLRQPHRGRHAAVVQGHDLRGDEKQGKYKGVGHAAVGGLQTEGAQDDHQHGRQKKDVRGDQAIVSFFLVETFAKLIARFRGELHGREGVQAL